MLTLLMTLAVAQTPPPLISADVDAPPPAPTAETEVRAPATTEHRSGELWRATALATGVIPLQLSGAQFVFGVRGELDVLRVNATFTFDRGAYEAELRGSRGSRM